jgi:hypothetical protein
MLLRDAALRSLDIMLAFPAKSGLQVAMSDLIAQAELSLRVWKEIMLVSVDSFFAFDVRSITFVT